MSFRALGPRAAHIFRDEAGGHRWMRVPPNDKRGRVQTSTITVAVLPEPTETEVRIDDRDLDVRTCRGSGAGGQHRNKTDSTVQMTHLPTGLTVRCESERSQHQNRATALATLRARLLERQRGQASTARASDRRSQIGSGQRGDKRRTVRVGDGQVVDHETGRVWRLRDYMRGQW